MNRNAKYKFYIDDEEVFPIYKSSAGITFSHADNELSFRGEFTEPISFIGSDYDRLIAKPVRYVNTLDIVGIYSDYYSQTEPVEEPKKVFSAKFSLLDCTIDKDHKRIELRPKRDDFHDRFDKVTEKTFNLCKDIGVDVTWGILNLPDFLQLYILGESELINLTESMIVRQPCVSTNDYTTMVRNYHFGLIGFYYQADVWSSSNPAINGKYAGFVYIEKNESRGQAWREFNAVLKPIRIYDHETGEYEYYGNMSSRYELHIGGGIMLYVEDGNPTYVSDVYGNIWDTLSDSPVYDTWRNIDVSDIRDTIGFEYVQNCNFTIQDGDNGEVIGGRMTTAEIWGRYVTADKDRLFPGQTASIMQKISDDDIVSSNPYYKYCAVLDGEAISNFADIDYVDYSVHWLHTTEPEFGSPIGSMWYCDPTGNMKNPTVYNPLWSDFWDITSLWLYSTYEFMSSYVEIPCYGVMSVFGSWRSKYANELDYMSFISGFMPNAYDAGIDVDGIYITPQSNIISGPGSFIATRYDMNMSSLLNLFCVWNNGKGYLFDNRPYYSYQMETEYIDYYVETERNLYMSGIQHIDADITDLKNSRNGNPWSAILNTYSYDKDKAGIKGYEITFDDPMIPKVPFYHKIAPVSNEYSTDESIDYESVSLGNFNPAVSLVTAAPDAWTKDCLTLLSDTSGRMTEGYALLKSTFISCEAGNEAVFEIDMPLVMTYERDINQYNCDYRVFIKFSENQNATFSFDFINKNDTLVGTYSYENHSLEGDTPEYFSFTMANIKTVRLTYRNTGVNDAVGDFGLVTGSPVFNDSYTKMTPTDGAYITGGNMFDRDWFKTAYEYGFVDDFTIDTDSEVISNQGYKILAKKQVVKFPDFEHFITFATNSGHVIKTELGFGMIDKLTITLSNNIINAELLLPYDE